MTIDEDEEISGKLTNDRNENELRIEFVSFKWTSTKGMINAIRMNLL